MIDDLEALEHFNKIWISHFQPEQSVLIFNTGRAYHDFDTELMQKSKWPLLKPDAIINADGTEIRWKVDGYKLDQDWHSRITAIYKRNALKATMDAYDQGNDPLNNTDVVRYHIILNTKDDAEAARAHFQKSHPESTFFLQTGSWLNGKYLIDAYPNIAGKGNALKYCAQKTNVTSDKVVWSADGVNDWTFLNTSYRGILVGNAAEELREKCNAIGSSLHYQAIRQHAKGIVEGLTHFGWIPTKGSGDASFSQRKINRILLGVACIFFLVAKRNQYLNPTSRSGTPK